MRTDASIDAPFSVRVMKRAELAACAAWALMFSDERKDYRYYEIVEDTLENDFEYFYFAICDPSGKICAVQPFFLVDQDLLEGVKFKGLRLISLIRRLYPRFFKLRTLMVGCAAGEGHLASTDDMPASIVAETLSFSIVEHARSLSARLIVLKEFPAHYRDTLNCFIKSDFARIPSMPMTVLNIEYDSFEAYIAAAMSGNARRHLRKNLKATAGENIQMSVTNNISNFADDIYPLYLQVFERSKFHFEKLTKEYFLRLGERMPDNFRLLLWHRDNKLVAFNLCIVQGEDLFSEYLGFDYDVAIDLHLYHYIVRDMTIWGMAQGYKRLHSSGLNYDPKLHLGHRLDPVDLYVRHTSPFANAIFKRLLPWLEPVRYDATLKKFPNYADLW